MGSPKKVSPVEPGTKKEAKEKPSPIKDNNAAAAMTKDESIEMVDQSDEDVKYKEEEKEKEKEKPKHKIDDKFKISQRFSEVCNVSVFKLISYKCDPDRLVL